VTQLLAGSVMMNGYQVPHPATFDHGIDVFALPRDVGEGQGVLLIALC